MNARSEFQNDPTVEVAGHFPVLQGELLAEFQKAATVMEFEPGERLYEEGFPCPFVPFIVSGGVRVYKIGESGREITLYHVRNGELCVLSTTCSISDKQYPAVAEAESPTTVYIVPGKQFRELMRRFPELQEFVFDLLTSRLMDMMDMVEEVKLKRVDLRLADYLLKCTSPPNTPVVDTTHAKLAVELGSAREVVSRILKEFENRGLITISRGQIAVMRRDRLSKFSEILRQG